MAWAMVTFWCMVTLPGGAPTIGATMSPTVTGMSHQPSSQARTPRVAQMCAYSASRSAVPRGIAPREFEIM